MKNCNQVTISRHNVVTNLFFFWHCFVSLINFSYWSKFHVSIITGSGVSFYKGLTTNPEIWNTHVWGLPNIFRLGQVRDAKFGKNVSNKMLLHAAQRQSYSFYHFWVIKGKPYFPPLPTKKHCCLCFLPSLPQLDLDKN